MDNPFKNTIPGEFRKIAQNDAPSGEPIAAVYFAKSLNAYMIQTQRVLANGEFDTITIGPLPSHVFESLSHILADVHGMDRRYYFLD